jgi:5-methylcytosine-specific restriction endonuclease McrA
MSYGPNHGRRGAVWRRVRLKVLERDAWTCRYCGRPANTVDHVVPLSDRPDLALEPSNLVAACRPCNSSKGRATHPTGTTNPGPSPRWSRNWTTNPSRDW